MKRRPIGDILVEMGVIDEHQLQSALAHHRQWGMPLGRAIIEKRFATAAQVLEALSKQTLMQAIDLAKEPLDGKLAALLPKKCADQNRAVPLRVEGTKQDTLVVAIAAPASLESLDAIKAASGKKRVQPFLADDASIERAFGIIYLGYDKAETAKVDPQARAIHLDEQEFEFETESNQVTASEPAPPAREAPRAATPVLAAAAVAPSAPRPVLVYGWNDQAGRTLALILAAEGISAKVATAEEVRVAAKSDVIVSPLPAIEAIVPSGTKSPGRLIVAGKVPEEDLPRAQVLGALGFLTAPVDTGLLLRAVRRCQAVIAAAARAA